MVEIDFTKFYLSKEILIGAGSVFAVYFFSKLFLKSYFSYKKNKERNAYPKDTVILHQFPKKKDLPSLSTPCLKLETWLRIANIKYESAESYFSRSSQGQVPFITLNKQDFHDSQFIIEHLTKVYENDLNGHLNQSEKSIARGFLKLLEESFKWTLYFQRTVCPASDIGMPFLLHELFFKRMIRKALKIQGYGKHSAEEIYHIGQQDLQALDSFVNKKKFLFGDKPSSEDSVLFAFISQVVYYDKGPLNKFLKESCPSLVAHFTTIKNAYWPEWKSVI